MQETTINKLSFIGQPYTASMMDENGSYYSVYQELEANEDFASFDETNELAKNRAYLVIFGPENFMFWQGMLYQSKDEITVPAGLFKYDLPEGDVVKDVRPGSEIIFSLPVGLTLQSLLDGVKKAGIDIPANLGLSEKPYLINGLNLEDNEQFTYVYKGATIDDVND